MVRSKWVKSLLAALASAGLAAGQQYSERIITVQEAGKPPQKCRVLDTVTVKNGVRQMHVLDLATNEVMTIEESADGGAHIVAKNIEPIATPIAPPTVLQAAAPTAPTLVPASASVPAPAPTTTAAAPTLNVTEPGHATRTATVLHTWRTNDGSRAYQVQAADNHEMMTIVESPAPVAPGNPPGAMTAKIYHWGASTTPPVGAPVAPGEMTTSTTVQSLPAPYQTKTTTASLPAMTPATQTKSSGSSTTTQSPYLPQTTTTQAPTASPYTKTTQARPVVDNWPTPTPPPAPVANTTTPAATPTAKTPNPFLTPAELAAAPTPAAPTLPAPKPPVQQVQATAPIAPPPPAPILPTEPLTFQPNPKPTTTAKAPEQPKDYHQEWGTPKGMPPARPAATTQEHKTTTNAPAPTTTAAKPPVDPVKQDPLLNPDQYVKPSVETKIAVPPSVTKAMGGETTLSGSSSASGNNSLQLPPGFGNADAPTKTTDKDHPKSSQTAPTGPKYVPTGTNSTSGATKTAPSTAPQRTQDKAPPAPVSEPEALNAFTPAPSQQPAGPPLNAFSSGVAAQGGYGMQMPYPGAYAPPGYPMMPPMPMGAAGAPMGGAPMSTAAMQPGYPGMPMASGYPVMQVAAWQQVQVPTAPMGQIAEPQLPSRGILTTAQTLLMLHDSLYPSQREWAADQLGMLDWKTNADVVEALVKTAQEDPAATVRAGCVRALARMNVNLVPVANALQALKADADPRVKTEVDRALARIAPSATLGRPAGEVQPAVATEPAQLGKPSGNVQPAKATVPQP